MSDDDPGVFPRKLRPPGEPIVGGGRWDEKRGAVLCTKHNKRGGPCGSPAVRGTDACRRHAGRRLIEQKAIGQANIAAWQASGGRTDIDYRMAVLGVLQMTYVRLSVYSEMLRKQATDSDGEMRESGVVGHRYGAAGAEGTIYPQSEEIRALVVLEAMERDRVVRYAKTAHDMGISSRLVDLAEKWGDVVAGRISTILESLELTPEQRALVPDLVTRHLGSIDMDEIAG